MFDYKTYLAIWVLELKYASVNPSSWTEKVRYLLPPRHQQYGNMKSRFGEFVICEFGMSYASLIDSHAAAWLILNPGGTVFDCNLHNFRLAFTSAATGTCQKGL